MTCHRCVLVYCVVLLSASCFAQPFQLVIPEGARACKVFREGQTAREEFAQLSALDFNPGTHELPTDPGVYPFDWMQAFWFGPNQEQAAPASIGQVTLSISGTPESGWYNYTLGQYWRTERALFAFTTGNLSFRIQDGEPERTQIVLDDYYLGERLWMYAIADLGGEWPTYLSYASCTYSTLPQWVIKVHLENGGTVQMLRPHQPAMAGSGPANRTWPHARLPEGEQTVSDYWRLVYAADHHNWNEKYWALFDPPLGDVYGLAIYLPSFGERPSAQYLDRDLRPFRTFEVRDYSNKLTSERSQLTLY